MAIVNSLKMLGGLSLGASVLVSTKTIYAMDEETKKSIYSQKAEKPKTSEEPTNLELYIRDLRNHANKQIDQFKKESQDLIDKWISYEKKVISSVRGVIAEDETFLPGALYVAIAALSGRIIFRKSNTLVRFTSPILLATAASFIVLPKSSANTVEKLGSKYDGFRQFSQGINSAKQSTVELQERLTKSVEERVHETRVYIAKSIFTDKNSISDSSKAQVAATTEVIQVANEKADQATNDSSESSTSG